MRRVNGAHLSSRIALVLVRVVFDAQCAVRLLDVAIGRLRLQVEFLVEVDLCAATHGKMQRATASLAVSKVAR